MVWFVAAGVAALVVYGRRLLRRSNRERREVLLTRVGHPVTLVTLTGKAFKTSRTGRLLEVRPDEVVLLWEGTEIAVPIAAIQEVWRGPSCLGRW